MVLIRELLHDACLKLGNAGVDTPEIDAALILGHCLGKSRTALYLMAEDELDSENANHFSKLLRLREQREPLAYILGTQEFWSLDFLVSPDVLIPRPETELLVERGISLWKENPDSTGIILDLCTGSGVIAIVLAKELGQPVVAVDLSMDALQVARKNAKLHDVSHLVSFVQSDLLSAIRPVPCFSLVLSNPPYVSIQELSQGLQPEVDRYEPHLALDGGDKGLEIIQKICDQLLPELLPGANLLMEIGAEQGDDVLSLFAAKEANSEIFAELRIEKDYSKHDRIFHAKIKDTM
jgi:release factor glutamine methyltransferase